ncbi:MAG TPA: hypothetical protein VGR28_05630, partial [Candidatus Thermoplasmatota archaeon]|nr:hypothetical protein [Candidatus Thermoplasmatota archaeon]
MRRAKGPEDGNTLVLEAVIIAVLLMAAILIPNFTPTPVREEASSRRGMAQTIEDLLAHLGATPDPGAKYPTALDRVVAEALQGNSTFLQGRVTRTLPVGILFNALLANGEALRQLRWERESVGEVVSGARLWSPSWETISAAPAIYLLPSDRASLEIQAVPIHRAYGFAEQAGVRAVVELELPGGTHVNASTFTPLQNRSAQGASLSLALRDAFGTPTGVVAPGSSNRTLVFWVKESQGRAAPAGSLLQVQLPPGVTNVGLNASRNPGWTSLAVSGNATYGWVAEGRLASDLSGAETTFEVNATLPATGPLHAVQATIDHGASGAFVGIVRNATATATTAGSVPGRGPFLMLPQLAPW